MEIIISWAAKQLQNYCIEAVSVCVSVCGAFKVA